MRFSGPYDASKIRTKLLEGGPFPSYAIDDAINEWLSEQPPNTMIVDIQFGLAEGSNRKYSALVSYLPPAEKI